MDRETYYVDQVTLQVTVKQLNRLSHVASNSWRKIRIYLKPRIDLTKLKQLSLGICVLL